MTHRMQMRIYPPVVPTVTLRHASHLRRSALAELVVGTTIGRMHTPIILIRSPLRHRVSIHSRHSSSEASGGVRYATRVYPAPKMRLEMPRYACGASLRV